MNNDGNNIKPYNFGFEEDEDDNNQINNNFYQNDNINNQGNNNFNMNNNNFNQNNINFNNQNNYDNNFDNNYDNNYEDNINFQQNEIFYNNKNNNQFNNNQQYQYNQQNNNQYNQRNNNNFSQRNNNNYNQQNNNQFNKRNNNQFNQQNYNHQNFNQNLNQLNNYNNNNNFNNQNNNNNYNQFNSNDNIYNNMNNNNNFNNNNYNNFNNNNRNNNQNINNQNINKKNINNQNKEKKKENPEKEKLRNAYNLFIQGVNYYKGLTLEIALDCFEKVKAIIDEVYPKIEKDKELKEKTDKFLSQVKQYISTTEKRIKNKYNYVPTYNFSGKITDPKKEVAKFLKETERASQERKKINYFIPDKKQKYKDYPSMYTNELKNNINNNNINNNQNKKDDKSIITNDLRDKVLSEIVENKPDVKFSDVVGLKEAKQILREIIIVPNLRPDLFKGLRAPPRGLLLFGPPGTGKTMIAKAVATECKCTFFNISASSLTSKYLGESEKLVRTLFQLAHEMQPSVVFIDEIESILSKRKEDENDAMKRLKTEFLIQFDGVGSGEDLRVLIIGATNRPFDLDPAIIRRLPKRVYVGPFNVDERKGFIKTIITQNKCNINDDEFLKIAEMCKNYSNSDLKELCREAAYEPLRELNVKSLAKVEELRPIVYEDFNKAVRKVRGTLTRKILQELEEWNKEFGALSNKIKIK